MRLRESIIIEAGAAAVWPLVADPVLQAEWNPKVGSVERGRGGPVQCGERFEMIYRMSGRETRMQVEVMDVQPAKRVVFVHRSTEQSVEQIIEVRYELTACAGGVRVDQRIDLGRSGIPWYFRALIWVISRFGERTEESYLERLKRLAEGAGRGVVADGGK